jgi:F-type H+-transporting ATPase subunit b
MLNLDPGIIIWAWITFIVLLIILYKFAWKPILSTIDDRENKIKDSLERAEKAKQEAELLLEDYQKKIKEAETEVQDMIKKNQEITDKTRNEMISQAKLDAQKIIEKTKKEIENERDAAFLQLKKDVADLVITTSKHIIGDILDESKHKILIDKYIKQMPDIHQ